MNDRRSYQNEGSNWYRKKEKKTWKIFVSTKWAGVWHTHTHTHTRTHTHTHAHTQTHARTHAHTLEFSGGWGTEFRGEITSLQNAKRQQLTMSSTPAHPLLNVNPVCTVGWANHIKQYTKWSNTPTYITQYISVERNQNQHPSQYQGWKWSPAKNRGNRTGSERSEHCYYTNDKLSAKMVVSSIGLALSRNRWKFPEVRFHPVPS